MEYYIKRAQNVIKNISEAHEERGLTASSVPANRKRNYIKHIEEDEQEEFEAVVEEERKKNDSETIDSLLQKIESQEKCNSNDSSVAGIPPAEMQSRSQKSRKIKPMSAVGSVRSSVFKTGGVSRPRTERKRSLKRLRDEGVLRGYYF